MLGRVEGSGRPQTLLAGLCVSANFMGGDSKGSQEPEKHGHVLQKLNFKALSCATESCTGDVCTRIFITV